MSQESKEFVQLRNDIYAAELSKCPAPVEVEPDVREEDNWPLLICRCCGKRRPIKPLMHVCMDCFLESL